MLSSAPSDPTLSKRASAGFLSSAKTFSLPVGEQFDATSVRGYYIDMRVKAQTPAWRPGERRLHVVPIQWALGCFERYLSGAGETWLQASRARADELLRLQSRAGPLAGGLPHRHPLAHTFELTPPWISAMAQGEAASLFVRLFLHTGDQSYADAARDALRPLRVAAEQGGARALLDGRAFPEEYPTSPPSLVLNGAIFAVWGLRDVAVALDDAPARDDFAAAVEMLAENLYRWDLGYWSRYDLFPHPVTNVASSFYHSLHINQLRALFRLTARREFADIAERWAGYERSRSARTRAFAHKALFRVRVPRNRTLVRLLPPRRLGHT